jgi:hypothetical protein
MAQAAHPSEPRGRAIARGESRIRSSAYCDSLPLRICEDVQGIGGVELIGMPGPAVHPDWSIEEVVQAGWDAYLGGGIESAGCRLVFVRIWANLVGSRLAIAEMEDFVRGYGIENAARRMNIAISTLARLRKEFQRLPAEGTGAGVRRTLKAGER